MRITHIITGLETGGAEVALRSLAIDARRLGMFESRVISLSSLGGIGESLVAQGIEVTALGMRNLWDAPKVFFQLIRLLREQRPDVVQTWLYHADFIGGLAARIAGIRHIVWGVHTSDLYAGRGVRASTVLVMRLCALLSHIVPQEIICVADASRRTHIKSGYASQKIQVVANGCDAAIYRPDSAARADIRTRHGIAHDAIVIGSVGRFNAYKDHQNMLQAAALLKERGQDFVLLIVGRQLDAHNAQLQRWIEEAGIADKVVLAGERPDISRYYAAMDIYCLHSRSEALPTVLIEAMLTELPCVTTNVGDAALMVGETGVVVAPENSEALASGLQKLLQEPPRERATRGTEAKQRALAHYSLSQTVQRYAEIYKQVCPMTTTNAHARKVTGFGEEWKRFDQSTLAADEHQRLFDEYFAVFPWESLPPGAAGFDLGCSSGRWAKLAAPRVGQLHCIDPSEALDVARKNLTGLPNVCFHQASVDAIPLEDASMDFGYSLGVLHHVPDTQAGIRACVEKLKTGAPFLIYLYYAFDNRPQWFRTIWKASDLIRRAISRMPFKLRYATTQLIAATVYYPLARAAKILEQSGMNVSAIPLSAYRNASFYTMRTDALDRFGTRLEQRFTRTEIERMMRAAGLEDICFSEAVPFWCAVGFRAKD